MIKLILFTVLIGGGYIEESITVDVCPADELNVMIEADNYKFYYCENEDE